MRCELDQYLYTSGLIQNEYLAILDEVLVHKDAYFSFMGIAEIVCKIM